MTPAEALARIREIVDACGSPGCVACPREIKATVGAVDERCSFAWVPGFSSSEETLRCELPAGHGLYHKSSGGDFIEQAQYLGTVAAQIARRTDPLAAEVHRLRAEIERLRDRLTWPCSCGPYDDVHAPDCARGDVP